MEEQQLANKERGEPVQLRGQTGAKPQWRKVQKVILNKVPMGVVNSQENIALDHELKNRKS